MQDNEKKPALRFKGFTDPWEQRKLGDVADIVGGGTPSTNNPNYWDGDIDWYAPAEIAGQIYFDSSQRKITEQGYENSSAKMLPPGTVLFTSRAGIGKTAILSKKGCTNQGFQSIVPYNDELDSYFVFSRTDELKQYGELVGAGSTFVEVSGKQMAAMNLKMPTTIEEQQTIGRFLKRLDTLITHHQRKYEKLVNIKKSMLDKMFPPNGASVPEIRFKGFTDPWEQRKLGDITVELSEYATQELGLPLLTSSRSGLMYQDEYRDSRTTKSTETLFSVVPVGTCTYRHMSDDDVFHMNINTLEKGLVSREYPVFEASKGNNLEFLVQHINSSEEFKAFCAEQKKGGTRTRLYYNTLCQFTVRVPALKEQAQISQCLKKLDTLITLHQRKLEKLQNIKKSCLEKMFV